MNRKSKNCTFFNKNHVLNIFCIQFVNLIWYLLKVSLEWLSKIMNQNNPNIHILQSMDMDTPSSYHTTAKRIRCLRLFENFHLFWNALHEFLLENSNCEHRKFVISIAMKPMQEHFPTKVKSIITDYYLLHITKSTFLSCNNIALFII